MRRKANGERTMKQSCEKCGKIFNMEEHLYICPKCNHYHSQVKYGIKTNSTPAPMPRQQETLKNLKSEVMDAIYDDGSNKRNIFDSFKKKNPIKKSQKAVSKIITAIIIVIMCILFIGTPAMELLDDFEFQTTENSVETEVVCRPVLENGSMNFGDISVKPQKADQLTVAGLEAPEGWKFVQVNFTTTYDDYNWDKTIKVYMEYEGQFYKALSPYDVDDAALEEELEDTGLDTTPVYLDEGYFLFLVPENAQAGELRMYCIDDTEEILEEAFYMTMAL